MEFTRLADVEVVETANDTDKVLIEQNGEIKRVPKTEVGGSGGNTLVITADSATETLTANMTLSEALEAFNKQELTGAVLYTPLEMYDSMPGIINMVILNATAGFGASCIALVEGTNEINLFWTEAGIFTEPPM